MSLLCRVWARGFTDYSALFASRRFHFPPQRREDRTEDLRSARSLNGDRAAPPLSAKLPTRRSAFDTRVVRADKSRSVWIDADRLGRAE